MLETVLAVVTVASTIGTVVIAVLCFALIQRIHKNTLDHFEANRPVGVSTAKLVEKQLDYETKVHEARLKDGQRMLEMTHEREMAQLNSALE